ncbi:hypothetical protein [Gulosibacter bifidus]|uniref:ABC transporter ATP-binding protein n=1 Tax=Gulosibacter bifidus TaxID=272239 RepID=A0ABW5RL44_9MICO|nr:hypothetical protein [Gulosibacter bifidus]
MQIALEHIEVGGRRPILPTTNLRIETGKVTVQACPTDQAPVVLALIAGGQMRPSRGVIRYNGRPARRKLKSRVAIIDAPSISAPDEYVALRSTLAEEYTYVGRVATPARIRRFLDRHDISEYADWPMIELPPMVRLIALTEMALLRPGIEAVVFTTPDRHGGSAHEIYAYGQAVAARGIGVLCITGTTAAEELLREQTDASDRIHLAPEPDAQLRPDTGLGAQS